MNREVWASLLFLIRDAYFGGIRCPVFLAGSVSYIFIMYVDMRTPVVCLVCESGGVYLEKWMLAKADSR